ncbi:MAG: hypothetical protein WCP97_09420 [bacterium]
MNNAMKAKCSQLTNSETESKMKKKLALNIGMNLLVALLFVYLNNQALQAGLEETFVFLAVLYGFVAVVGNAVFFLVAGKE